MKKFECCLAYVCLSDYWSGHLLPYVAVTVWRGMTLAELKASLKFEIDNEAVMGSRLPYYDTNEYSGVLDAMKVAVDAVELKDGVTLPFGNDLDLPSIDDDTDDAGGWPQAYFIFITIDED